MTHFASLPYGPEFSDLLRRIDDYPAKLSNKLALKFLMLSFLRTVEIRLLRWDWVDWKREIINIPAEAMKKRYPHMVVCSPQMMDILRRAHDLNSRYDLIFPSTENKETIMSSDTLRRIIERCGYKGRQTGHPRFALNSDPPKFYSKCVAPTVAFVECADGAQSHHE